MTQRVAAIPAPGPLEQYLQNFDDLFSKLNQREAIRRYLEGLLLPMERNKTLTGLANTEPIVGAQHASAQKLQWFLSESSWDPTRVNEQRLLSTTIRFSHQRQLEMPILEGIRLYAIVDNLLPPEPSRCAGEAAETSTVKGGSFGFPLDGAQSERHTAQSGMAEADSRRPASAGGS